MLAGMAAVEQDETGKPVSFEDSVAFLLQFDPVVAKNVKAKGLGVDVSGTTGEKTAGGVTVGKSGVELRWHEPEKFSKLSKEQKAELSEWNKTTNPKKNGGNKIKSCPVLLQAGWTRSILGYSHLTHGNKCVGLISQGRDGSATNKDVVRYYLSHAPPAHVHAA